MQTVCDHGTHWIVSEDGAWRPVAKDSAEGQQITGDREALRQTQQDAQARAIVGNLKGRRAKLKRKLQKVEAALEAWVQEGYR